MKFESIPLTVAYRKLEDLAPQSYVDMGPGLSIKRKSNGVPVMRIHYDAIPQRNRTLNPLWSAPAEYREKFNISFDDWQKLNERRNYSTSGWDREQEINYRAGGGDKLFASLLSTFGNIIIITDPYWYPQPEWDCVGGFDHGKTNATCLEKAYLDYSGNIYMCGEFYQMKTDAWANNVWQNIPILNQMPDLAKMRWIRADPSMFNEKELQPDGTYTSQDKIYKKQGFKRLTTFPTTVTREDLSFEERLNDHWANLAERKPTLYIVCRNELERRQPGLHPYDCPNLLWELRRMRRKELSSTQLLQRNPTDTIVDKDNHAWDAAKYLIMSLPRPTSVPLEVKLKELVKDLNPMSANIAATRFVNMSGGLGRQAPRHLDMRRKGRMR